MQVSKLKMNAKIEKQVNNIFYQLIADIKGAEDAKIFIRDFLTKSEKTILKKRLAIAMYLEKGHTYDHIKNSLKVSSATIASVDKMMNRQSEGFILALQKIMAEEWADNLVKRITRFFGKK